MDMDEIAQGERECLREQVTQLQQRVTELQRENAKLQSSLDVALGLLGGELGKYGEAVEQLR